ncbi:MAG: RNA methyltransferase [Pseudomonadota bacterium]
MALVHHPVYNRLGEVIAAALTNLDLHDLARVAATYGARRCFIITPLDDQRALARRLIAHWVEGFGAEHNADRKRAMGLLAVTAALEEAMEAIREDCGGASPRLIATAAREGMGPRVEYNDLAQSLNDAGPPCLLLFGTASGLAEDLLKMVDAVLPPIEGVGGYNHLSVRSAAAIVLDRLRAAGSPPCGGVD